MSDNNNINGQNNEEIKAEVVSEEIISEAKTEATEAVAGAKAEAADKTEKIDTNKVNEQAKSAEQSKYVYGPKDTQNTGNNQQAAGSYQQNTGAPAQNPGSTQQNTGNAYGDNRYAYGNGQGRYTGNPNQAEPTRPNPGYTGGQENRRTNAGANQGGNNKPPKKKSKAGVVVGIIAAILAICVLGVAVTVGYGLKNYDSDSSDGKKPSGDSEIEEILNGNDDDEDADDDEDIDADDDEDDIDDDDKVASTNTHNAGTTVIDVSDVVKESLPSVVAITSKTLVESNFGYGDFWDYYFGGQGSNDYGTYEQEAAGSGIIIDQTDSELLIVTNNHVVEGSDSLKINFYEATDKEKAIDAVIKGTDEKNDVAVVAVKLDDIPQDILKNIKVATLGDSDDVEVGDGVIVIGNALGYGQSVTTGIISAKDREVDLDTKKMTLLQTDAAINGGNSGGALLNSSGEVIGINVAKYSSNGSFSQASIEGMGFAIPISNVKDVISGLEEMKTRTKVADNEKGYIGITGNDITSEISKTYGIPVGAYVNTVSDKGPAKQAGMVEGDVIVKFDGRTVSSMTDLTGILDYYKAGEKVKVTVLRRSSNYEDEVELDVTLTDRKSIS